MAFSWLASMPFLNQLGVSVDLSNPDQLRVLLGTPLYLATIALFAFAVGALLRHSAGALAIVLALLLVLENVFALLPFRFFEVVSPFLPSTSGGRILLDSGTLEFMDAGSTGAHLTIVFTALAVARETHNRTGLAIRNVVRQLRPLRSATIEINGATQTFRPTITSGRRAWHESGQTLCE